MRSNDEYSGILKSHGLRITDCRLNVLEHFLKHNRSLFQNDIERHFPEYDRVTIYRTLKSFLDSGIVHRIPNDSGVASYGLCHNTCSPNQHTHNHIHFKCNNCGKIECLDDQVIPPISLPDGYQFENINWIAEGICEDCSIKSN